MIDINDPGIGSERPYMQEAEEPFEKNVQGCNIVFSVEMNTVCCVVSSPTIFPSWKDCWQNSFFIVVVLLLREAVFKCNTEFNTIKSLTRQLDGTDKNIFKKNYHANDVVYGDVNTGQGNVFLFSINFPIQQERKKAA